MDMSRADSLELDFRQTDAMPDIVRSRQWRGVQAEFSRLHLPAEYEFNWSGATHYLALHDLVLSDGEMDVDGLAPVAGGDLRGKMTYVPASCGLKGWAAPAPRQNTFTVVYFDAAVLEQEVEDGFGTADLRPLIYFDDPALKATMKKFEEALSPSAGAATSVYAETLALVAALETFRLQRGLRDAVSRTGGLTAGQERLVREYIEENLAVDFGLDELAATTGLSRYHFSRRFKATFGVPPHRYVTTRKIERARQLLAETRFPVSHVAAASGFTSAANFIRAFREQHGMTPRDYRRGI